MTLAEKIGQLQLANNLPLDPPPGEVRTAPATPLDVLIRRGEVGSVINEVDPAKVNGLQRLAVKESRLGIPLIFGRDVIHGFRTIFPIPLAQAASWNRELVEAGAAIAAGEARSVGVNWTYAPMVDIARDPRWGRIAESLGEDPCLGSELAAAMVRGFQGPDMSAPDRVAACAKHFAGYGAAEGGRDYNSAAIPNVAMRNIYLPPFHAAVDAGVATLMTSFNDVNGIPGSANEYLLRDVLRAEWGFRGFVVSDWESIREMIVHGYCRDASDAARAAALAGVNVEMVSQTYRDHLPQLIKAGAVPEKVVDDLVAGVLRIKFRLGLFERPYVDAAASRLVTDEHLQTARDIARQSVVLLKNDKQLLPLNKSHIKTLAVIGPLADSRRAQLGTWIPDAVESDTRTPLAALRESAGAEINVLHASGLVDDLDQSHAKVDEAVATAKQADAIILIVGETGELSGEARSRANLDLPGSQNALVDAIAATGKPIVLIVEAGRPLTIGAQVAKAGAVLYSFHAGTMAGPALADLIWGIESPSGKLPVTFPKTVGQIPLYYSHTNTGRPARAYDFARDSKLEDRIDLKLGNNSNYIDATPYPLYPFGYGLTYTTFEYGPTKLSTETLNAADVLTIRTPVTNTGKVAADEIVQLYIRNTAPGMARPVRELKNFQRISIKPGEMKTVEFALPCASLAYFDIHERQTLAPGKYEVYVGDSSLAPFCGSFNVIK
jgi:beta-glucosidase